MQSYMYDNKVSTVIHDFINKPNKSKNIAGFKSWLDKRRQWNKFKVDMDLRIKQIKLPNIFSCIQLLKIVEYWLQCVF